MSVKSIFSARNPVVASGYALLAYASAEVALANAVPGGKTVVKTFLDNIALILNGASIVVVTIAIIFAGYQIAFNNKRISEVAPVLLGGVLIGGAAQIATMLIAGGTVAQMT